ncbi:helix-turn-helix domain-containing protein [Streptomyces sp. SCSIO ZS0520]|uniref:helix-turn-helix domain-containing protein n=1 Tax=Streptomyces sp. SCSIO ZS0520 TaxID=2892996 RepID=UPI0021DA0084|nr:helix-turn-helix transcriptional regulator [Streptomyces sp. SCSIO ZS0520]
MSDTPRTQFADLIRERRAQLGLSLANFAARAVDPETETQITSSWLHRLESGKPITPPQLPELRALAAAAELDLELLQDAAGQQFHGVEPVWSESGHARAYVRRMERMTDEQREQLMRFLDSVLPPDDE